MTCPKCHACHPSDVIPPQRGNVPIFCVMFTCGASQHYTADGQPYVPPARRVPTPAAIQRAVQPPMRACLRCEVPFERKGAQRYCKPCAEVRHREAARAWERKHRKQRPSREQRISHEMACAGIRAARGAQ